MEFPDLFPRTITSNVSAHKPRGYLLKKSILLLVMAIILCPSPSVASQVVVKTASAQKRLLKSDNPQIAANKRLVFDFWRKVIEGGHLELADHYLSSHYVQHNPNVPGGRAGFVRYFSKFSKPHAVADHAKAPLIAIVGEGDLVVLIFERRLPAPTTNAITTQRRGLICSASIMGRSSNTGIRHSSISVGFRRD